MNRRDFLLRLGGAVAAVTLSPLLDLSEIIPAPAVTGRGSLMLAEINEITLRYIRPGLSECFFRESPLLAYLQSRTP